MRASHPMTRQYCHIGSRTIAYLDSAPGDSGLRTYVLLHAFPLGANMWEPQMRAFPNGWRLITPDLRGFGGSTGARFGRRAVDRRLCGRRRRTCSPSWR